MDVDAAFAAIPGLRPRPGQLDMAGAVWRAVEDGTPLMVHAPTGIGKSLGYLVPAVASGRRVTIATATKALQSQLVERDLPRVADTYGITYELALGRSNFYCRSRGDALFAATRLAATPAEEAALDLVEWAESTDTGLRTDAPPGTRDEVWELVSTTGEDCPGQRGCSFANACFAERARARAREADVVVTNHHLLLLELELRRLSEAPGVMLPDTGVIVIDEAHRLADTAAELFGATVRATRPGRAGAAVDTALRATGRGADWGRRLRGVWDERTAPLRTGAVVAGSRAAHRLGDALGAVAAEVTAAGNALAGVDATSEELEGSLHAAKQRVAGLARDLVRLAQATAEPVADPSRNLAGLSSADLAVWIEETRTGDRVVRSALVEPGEVLRDLLWHRPLPRRRWAGAAIGRAAAEPAEGDRPRPAGRAAGGDAGAPAERVYPRDDHPVDGYLAGELDGDPGGDWPPDEPPADEYLDEEHLNEDHDEGGGDAGVGPEGGAEGEGARRPATIACSATLAVGGSLDAAAAALGVDDPVAMVQDSPFDFARNAMLYVPAGVPFPGGDGFAATVAEQARQLVRASRGRALVLCTSWRSLESLAAALGDLGYELLVQGTDSAPRLAERFRDEVDSVLVATRTFFEGIDVPGESLSLLVLDKLPFPPPDDPLLAERGRRAQRKGGSRFESVWLPAAAVSLQQALGRLIRTEDDRGVMAVLDRRLADAPYGKLLRASLPPAPLTRAIGDVEAFLAVAHAPA